MTDSITWLLMVLLAGIASFAIGRKSTKRNESGIEGRLKPNSPSSFAIDTKGNSLAVPSSPSSSGIPDYASAVFGARLDANPLAYRFFVSAGSQRGQSHRENSVSRQDNFCVFRKSEYLVVAISDGVSSSPDSHLGSTFLVQNFERLFDEVFPNGPTFEKTHWRELNKKLSQNLVAMFASRAKRDGDVLPEAIEDLRIQAASRFASTLEVLVCAKVSAPGEMEYLYVRLAGDGKVFAIGETVEEVIFGQEQAGRIKSSNVRALPIFDGDPLIASGHLPSGHSIAIATDGIGDYLMANEEWSNSLRKLASADQPDEKRLLEFLNHSDDNARDDRTIVIVTNCQ